MAIDAAFRDNTIVHDVSRSIDDGDSDKENDSEDENNNNDHIDKEDGAEPDATSVAVVEISSITPSPKNF